MPRTPHSVKSSLPPPIGCDFQVDAASCSSAALDFAHVLFAPLHYESGYAYPLIVWLHGQGADERQLQRVMPLISMRNYAAAAPQGLRVALAGEPAREGYGWQQTDEHIQQAERRIFEVMEMAGRKLHVARRRVFLAGFDCGGTMAFRVAMNHPEHFAGVISLCGAFPAGGTPLSNLVAARRLGMFLLTGRGSREYPASAVCDNLRLLHSAGLSITLRQYPCGHELLPQMLADIDRWIIEQIAPPADPAAESNPEWSREAD